MTDASPLPDVYHKTELARLQQVLAQATEEAERQKAEITLLQRRLAAAEQQHQAAAMQLRKLSQPHFCDVRNRLHLAVALDDPQALYSTKAITAEIQRLRAEAAATRDQMHRREAELLSSTSWRVTAPLRVVAKLMRRRR